jgi:nicotinate-nucleotide adenylyltransferase
MRTGIFGGSFNPVHNGHMHLAETVKQELNLDRVFLVPSGISPHRSSSEYASGEERMEMLRIACRNADGIEPCGYELESDRVSYTVYTVRHFREMYPEDELFLLVGSDMLLCFDKWYEYREILKNTSLAVVSRKDGDIEQLNKKAEELSEYGHIFISGAAASEMSSSEIRKKIVKNSDLSCYLDENVVQYIRLKKLFGISDEVNSDVQHG